MNVALFYAHILIIGLALGVFMPKKFYNICPGLPPVVVVAPAISFVTELVKVFGPAIMNVFMSMRS